MKDLKGGNCLITGAASGIGRSLALGLTREGMNLFLVDLDMAGLEAVKEEIGRAGGRALTARCDVSNFDEIKALELDARARMGEIDLLVNNAGIAGAGLAEELDPVDWMKVLEINTWSIIYSVRAFLPAMIKRGRGHIVNTGSGAGVVGIPYHIQYVVSKFAVVGLSEALYSEIKHVHPGIDVSVICPSYLKTRIIDRTNVKLPSKLVPEITAEEFGKRTEEFKKYFWERYNKQGMSVEKAVDIYIKGIKKGNLYIFDTAQLRVALVIKGLSDRLYRKILRREGYGHLKMIKDTFSDMGIKVS